MSGLGLLAILMLLIFLLLIGSVFLLGLKQSHIMSIGLKNLKRNVKMNFALISATCVSTIVITGSLIAGDSLQESITSAAYDNLSEVDEIVTSDGLFNGSLVDRLAENESLASAVDHLSPMILMKGVVESPSSNARTNFADIIGFNHAYLEFGDLVSVDGEKLGYTLDQNEVYVNRILAQEIEVSKGDKVNISFPRLNQVFEAIFLGNQRNTNLKVQFEIKDVVKTQSLGRFQLNANRKPPQNIYVPLESLQKVLGAEGEINTILVSNQGDEKEGTKQCNEVSGLLRNAMDDILTYEDAGLKLVQNTEKGYVKLEAENVFFSYDYYELLENNPSLSAQKASSSIITYFWNSLSFENRSVPYSTITAFDPALDEDFGLFTVNGTLQQVEGILEENEIIINNWTAERLGAGIGDIVSMNYSLMDEFYNIRYLTRNFTVKYIVNMDFKANDNMLMPSFPGIEGKISAFDWDPPFPIELNRITEDDEKYWQDFKGTPKAFIGFETGNELWRTDIGNITQIRLLPSQDSNLSLLTEQVERVLNDYIGMSQASLTLKTVKLDALDSAQGIEIFTQMFLAFSAACIIASAVLIVLLITLRVESKEREIGTLRALGFGKGAINRIFMTEGMILSITGGFMGVLLGLLFGFFLISGMNTFWSSIVEGSPVLFYYTLDSLVIGFCSGIIISILTMMIVLRYEGRRTIIGALRHISYGKERKISLRLPSFMLFFGLMILIVTALLDIDFQSEIGLLALGIGPMSIIFSLSGFIYVLKNKCIHNWAGVIIVIYTLILMYYFVDMVPIIELFFLSGFMLLSDFLMIFYHNLMKTEKATVKDEEKGIRLGDKRWLANFAVKNAGRKSKRTMFTVILFSLTLFVLVSLTINLQGAVYDVKKAVKESGGDYQIMGDSTNPIFANLNHEDSRMEAVIQSEVFNELKAEQFKTKGDVGGTCSNLNRAANPRIIGANESFFKNNTFAFVAHEDLNGQDNPWYLLKEMDMDGKIPAIGDYNTIVWILGLDLGSTISVIDENGDSIGLKIVGITGNSIFQGSMIIWDENFDSLYPTNNGYQLFLFKSEAKNLKPQINELESALARYGFDAYTVESVVVENILIENTYISIFQVLLLFGLILGTLGFGIVASRNAMERRREIGILRAIGFSRSTILKSLLLENSYIVVSGMIIGSLSGIIASSVYLLKMNLAITSWPWLYVMAILLTSYVVAMISSLIPILRASKMSITNAIRIYE